MNCANDAVRVTAAHHRRVGLAGKADVVGITSVPAQKHRIFAAGDRLSHGEFLNRYPFGRRIGLGQFLPRSVGRFVQIHSSHPPSHPQEVV